MSSKEPTKEELAEREKEATSKDTVKDVAGKESNTRQSDKAPSPDGALDEHREVKDADPV